MNITLKNNSGFKWFENNTLFFKGYFYVDDYFYEKEDALNYLLNIKTVASFKAELNAINGVFSFIISLKDTICIASDLTRAFPIFYTTQKGQLFLSDDILHLKKEFTIDNFDKISEIEFKASNHTHGKKTLLKNVFQVQASEYLIINNDEVIDRNFFFSYAIEKESSDSYSNLKNKTIITFNNVFKRFVDSLNNRTIVVPLSGGFDSRLIAIMLKNYNYKNVVCYTYGRKDSFEIENSQRTAKTLNFEWHFIEYKDDLISDFLITDEFRDYAHFAGKLSSMPNLQEYFAVKHLKKHNLISNDAIFVPGYAGDLLGGSQFLKVIPENLKQEQIADLIIRKKFSNYPLSKTEKKTIKNQVEQNLFHFDENYVKKIPSSVFEDYDIKEKIAKYIFNSANFYTFFGYEHRFPFWDKELLNLFKKVPVKYKNMKMLFDTVLINEYFKPNTVYFENELQPSEKSKYTQKIKGQIKPFLPTFVKQRFLQKNDWNNYKPITDQIDTLIVSKGLKVQKSSKDYNDIITQWYLYFSKNMI